jgi:imidazolonepropionase-like amidohydrolase
LFLCGFAVVSAASAQTPPSQTQAVIFEGVRIFDGTGERLSVLSNVLVTGNVIADIRTGRIDDPPSARVTRIAGGGRTLMPGLIDAHTHIMYATLSPVEVLTSDLGFVSIAAAKAAEEMLLRGFTSIRDVGGPVFGLKRGIDRGLATGPRIWPGGAFISQSGGHGDFRLPTDMPARPGDFTYSERVGGAALADGPDLVRLRTRELLALGASHIKLMAGGGVSSQYDPLDVTQYTVAELRAAVEAAENWGTYVTVHAYTPRAVRQALDAGVRVLEHGQLLDDATARLIAEKGVWWSLQPFIEDGSDSRFPEGSINRIKQLQLYQGTDTAYALARKHGIRVAWGTDTLSAPATRQQSAYLTRMTRWYTPAQILKMATADNADLLALSGERSPYRGKLGVVQVGALADLLLVDGDPTQDIRILENSAANLRVIMKDGRIYKNTLR